MLPLLQEGLAVDIVLPHGGGLPWKVSPRGITLEQVGLAIILVATADQERDAEGTDAARLGVLLHHHGHALHQLRRRNGLVVHEVVILGHLAGTTNKKSAGYQQKKDG